MAGGEGFEEELAVGFGEDAFVHEYYPAFVVVAADEAAEALFEAQDCFGEEVVGEGASAFSFHVPAAGFYQGAAWYGEGEFGDDYQGQGGTWDVDSFPEAFYSEKN